MGKFYIYKHTVDGNIKYVGSNWISGNETRAWQKRNRTKMWYDFFRIKNHKYINYSVEIIEYIEDENKPSKKTLEKENIWISYYKDLGQCDCNSIDEHSEEWKEKLRESMKGRYDGENNPMFGKGSKISGLKNGKSKPVKCIETNEVFVSASEASIKLNCNRQFITDVCKGKRSKHKGLTFEFVDKGELINDNR